MRAKGAKKEERRKIREMEGVMVREKSSERMEWKGKYRGKRERQIEREGREHRYQREVKGNECRIASSECMQSLKNQKNLSMEVM